MDVAGEHQIEAVIQLVPCDRVSSIEEGEVRRADGGAVDGLVDDAEPVCCILDTRKRREVSFIRPRTSFKCGTPTISRRRPPTSIASAVGSPTMVRFW